MNTAVQGMLRLADYEKWAQENLRKSTWEFFRAATEDGSTYADNFAALKRSDISNPGGYDIN